MPRQLAIGSRLASQYPIQVDAKDESGGLRGRLVGLEYISSGSPSLGTASRGVRLARYPAGLLHLGSSYTRYDIWSDYLITLNVTLLGQQPGIKSDDAG